MNEKWRGKIISIILVFAMVMQLFAGFGTVAEASAQSENTNVVVNNPTQAGIAQLETFLPGYRDTASYLALEGNYTTEIFTFTTKIANQVTPNILIGARTNGTDAMTSTGIFVSFAWDATNNRGFYEIHNGTTWIAADILTLESGKEYTFHVSMGEQFNMTVGQGGTTVHTKTVAISNAPTSGNFMVWNMDAERTIAYEVPQGVKEPTNKNVVVNNPTQAGTAQLETILPGYRDTASYLALEGNYTTEIFTFTTKIANQVTPNILIGARTNGTDAMTSTGIFVSFAWDATNNRGFYEIHNGTTWIAADILTLESGKEYTFHVSMGEQFNMTVGQGGTTVHTKTVAISNAPTSGNFMVWNMDAERTIAYEVPQSTENKNVIVSNPTEAGTAQLKTILPGYRDTASYLALEGNYTTEKFSFTTKIANQASPNILIGARTNGTDAMTSTGVFVSFAWDATNNRGFYEIHNGTTWITADILTLESGKEYTFHVSMGDQFNMTVEQGGTTVHTKTVAISNAPTSGNFMVWNMDAERIISYEKPGTAPTPLTIQGLSTAVPSSVTEHESKNILYMFYVDTNQVATTSWTGNENSAKLYLNGKDDEETYGMATWDNTGGRLYVHALLSPETEVNSITIKAGTQYTINNILYEVTDDFTVYINNGTFSESMFYDITKVIDGKTTTETVNGNYVLPEVFVADCVTLGWEIEGKLYKVGTTLSAKAEGYTINAVCAEFSQINGAQVRLTTANENEQIGGIRFVCKLGEDSKKDYITQMGILIMPTDYMTNGELTHDNYRLQEENYSNKGYREFVVNNADMQLEVYAQDEASKGVAGYYLKGSIVNLYDYNYTRSYSARSFLKIEYADGNTDYVYTDYNKDNHTRKICDIAKKMIETYPEKYAPIQNQTYPIVYEYAKVADTMESFAFFGPGVVVTDGAYDVAATKSAIQEYADAGFKYLWLDGVGYHYHDRYYTSTVTEEQNIFDNPGHPTFDLKQTMQIAKECGLEVIVYDVSLRQLSVCDIPLVNANATNRQVLGLWLQTGDAQTVELIGSRIDESKFSADGTTYSYDGANVTGYTAGQARVLNCVYQFASEETLKEWVAIKMSAYAQEDNFRGVMLADEPTNEVYDQLALMTKVIKKLYPNAYVQNSNLPCYGYQSGSGTFWDPYNDGYDTWSADNGDWKKLLQAHASAQSNVTETGINFYPFARWYHDSFLVDDYYTYELRNHYLSSLQFLAKTMGDAGINLEFTIQSYAVEKFLAEVSAEQLELQANLALAFGAKTLAYFRYTGAGEIEPGSDNWKIEQSINSDADLKNAVFNANKNGNYLKAHMTFFEYQASKVFGDGTYVSTDKLQQASKLKNEIFAVSDDATVLVNEFYNEHTGQYGYYVVNLAQLNDENGNKTTNDNITITLSENCFVYQNYKNYTSEKSNKVSSVTLSDGQGAFVVVK